MININIKIRGNIMEVIRECIRREAQERKDRGLQGIVMIVVKVKPVQRADKTKRQVLMVLTKNHPILKSKVF